MVKGPRNKTLYAVATSIFQAVWRISVRRRGSCLTRYSSLAILMQSNFAGRRIGQPGEWWHYALSVAAHASPHDAQEPVRVQSPIVIADKSNFSRTLSLLLHWLLRLSSTLPASPFKSPIRHSQPPSNNVRTNMHLRRRYGRLYHNHKISMINTSRQFTYWS